MESLEEEFINLKINQLKLSEQPEEKKNDQSLKHLWGNMKEG